MQMNKDSAYIAIVESNYELLCDVETTMDWMHEANA
jgi:hypothetical protein